MAIEHPEPSPLDSEIVARAKKWLTHDPDPETCAQLQDLLHRAETDPDAAQDIQARFAGQLMFGTAGLRAEMGTGSARLNMVTIAHSTAGFAKFLLAREKSPSVVIGYDGRLKSADFAQETAQVLAGAGITVSLLPEPFPTPVLAFAVRALNVTAGVMITASHNQPADNGYKVYLGGADNGHQINNPDDKAVMAEITKFADTPYADIVRSDDFNVLGYDIWDDYVSRTAVDVTPGVPIEHTPDTPLHRPKIAYTALHGVASKTMAAVFDRAGLSEFITVTAQDAPDGAFPTVEYPNPEEHDALTMVRELGAQIDADLLLASDPDGDRVGVLIPEDGEYRALTGNEIGLLLGWRCARKFVQNHDAKTGTLANTVVSSPALEQVAKHYGMTYQATLSGFKWVSRAENLVFGFEEALGYLVNPDTLGDKDGISAAAAIASLACELADTGMTLSQHLTHAKDLFGNYASRQIVLRFASTNDVQELAAAIKKSMPCDFGGFRVKTVTDYTQPGLMPVPAPILRLDLTDGSRIMVRPSGTEPKLKIYIDAANTQTNQLNKLEDAFRNHIKNL